MAFLVEPSRAPNWALPIALLAALTLVPFRVPRSEALTGNERTAPLAAARAPAGRVLFILIDGLGVNAAYHPGWMPRLQARRESAAWGTAWASFPTITPSGVASLMSGHRRRPAVEVPGGAVPTREADSLLAHTSAAGRKVFVVGQQDWRHLYAGHGASMDILDYEGPPLHYDETQIERVLPVVAGRRGPWDLVALHLFDLDPIGHLEGIGGPHYLAKLRWLDETVEKLAALAGPKTIVVVTADHGQTLRGNHGGEGRDERRVPLVLWGPGVRPGPFGDVELRDVAPTLAALMGVAPPSGSLGWPILPALAMDARQRAAFLIDLAEQRRRLAEAASARWPWLATHHDSRIEEARRLSSAKSFDAAGRLWHTLLGLGLVTLAAGLGSAWPAPAVLASLSAGIGTAYLLGLLLPIAIPSLWPMTSWLTLIAAAGLLATALACSLGQVGIRRRAWVCWSAALLLLLVPDFVDLRLTLWIVMWGICLWELSRSSLDRWRPLALMIFVVAAVGASSPWFPEAEMSALRGALPFVLFRLRGTPPYDGLGHIAAALAGPKALRASRRGRPAAGRVLLRPSAPADLGRGRGLHRRGADPAGGAGRPGALAVPGPRGGVPSDALERRLLLLGARRPGRLGPRPAVP